MTSTGANVQAAIAHLAEAGYPVRRLAGDLGVAASTVYRWRRGQHRPNAANFAALVEQVDAYYSTEVHKRRLTVASVHLRNAADALVTDQQRAEDDRLAEAIRQHQAAGERRREAERAQRRARFVQRRTGRQLAREHQPVTSVTRDVDPFLLAGGQPYQEVFAS